MSKKKFTDKDYLHMQELRETMTWAEICKEIGYENQPSSLGTLYKNWERSQANQAESGNVWAKAIQTPLEQRIADLENQLKKVRKEMKLIEKLQKLEFEVSEISRTLQISSDLPPKNDLPDESDTLPQEDDQNPPQAILDDNDEPEIDEAFIKKVKGMIEAGEYEDEVAEKLGIEEDIVHDIVGGVFDEEYDEDDNDFSGDDI